MLAGVAGEKSWRQMVEKGIALAVLPETAARRSQEKMVIRVIPETGTWALRQPHDLLVKLQIRVRTRATVVVFLRPRPPLP